MTTCQCGHDEEDHTEETIGYSCFGSTECQCACFEPASREQLEAVIVGLRERVVEVESELRTAKQDLASKIVDLDACQKKPYKSKPKMLIKRMRENGEGWKP